MSKAAEWDSIVNGHIAMLTAASTRMAAQKATADSTLARLSGGQNPDVVAARATLTTKANRLAARLSNISNEITAANGRLYASLTDEQKAVVDAVCTNCGVDVQCTLAKSTSDLQAFFSRLIAAKASVLTPENVTAEDMESLAITIITDMSSSE